MQHIAAAFNRPRGTGEFKFFTLDLRICMFPKNYSIATDAILHLYSHIQQLKQELWFIDSESVINFIHYRRFNEMALTPCPHCGNGIGQGGKTCPHCGGGITWPGEEDEAVALGCIVLIFIVVFFLGGFFLL